MSKVSIITPSFNQGKFIEDTIRSVLNQNYQCFEHIIIDGGSIDGTIEILKKYPHLKWISEKDSGQTDAINKGLKLATGEILAYLNSDDYYLPNIFSFINDFFNENPNCFWLIGNVIFIDSEGNFLKRKKPLYSPSLMKLASSSVYQPNIFFRREVLEKAGFPKTNFHAIMDQEWFCRISEISAPNIVNKDFAYFRWHAKSKSSSSKKSDHYRMYLNERMYVVEKYYPNMYNIAKLNPIVFHFIIVQYARIIKLLLRIKIMFK